MASRRTTFTLDPELAERARQLAQDRGELLGCERMGKVFQQIDDLAAVTGSLRFSGGLITRPLEGALEAYGHRVPAQAASDGVRKQSFVLHHEHTHTSSIAATT